MNPESSPTTTDDPRVDELRQRLRSLGYLDAGVDRFVLGPARATRRPSSIALFASLRIGALAAFLLGPAAAVGLSARMPGLVTGPRDALVVAIYLGAFFGVAITVAAFLASLMVSWLARRSGAPLAGRGGALSRTAGALVALVCLTYLTLWWQTVIAGFGWSAPLWTLSALAVATAISVLLGHAVTVTSSAVVVANARASEGPAVETRLVPVTSWRTSLLAGAVAFGGAALLLTWTAGPNRRSQDSVPALTVVPTGLRVRVIAIDGFDLRIFEELSGSGRVPALTAALQGTLAQLDQRPGEAGDPARVWTTVATGQPPEIHAVQGLETRRVAGVQGSVHVAELSPLARAIRGTTDLVRLTRPAIASGIERRAKTFWEVAAEAGLRTAVVNWWATWPARPDAGIVLSDRATLRLEYGGQLDAEISPETLYAPLRQRWPTIKARAGAMATEALNRPADAAMAALLQRSAELDAIQLVLLSDVATPVSDLSVVYLPGLDIAQHALLGAQHALPGAQHTLPRGGQAALAASAIAARLEALKDYYAALDHMLASVLKPATDELVIVVTEPGRVTAEGGARMAARGTAVRPRSPTAGAATSVAPTILYALGVPIGRDLTGGPLLEMFTEQFTGRYPVRFVATYGQPIPTSALREGRPLDQEMIDRLRSLGYVR